MSNELPLTALPNWSVRTRYHTQTKTEKLEKREPHIRDHQLLYGEVPQQTRNGRDGFNSLNEMATFLNRKKLAPRKREECAADATTPPPT